MSKLILNTKLILSMAAISSATYTENCLSKICCGCFGSTTYQSSNPTPQPQLQPHLTGGGLSGQPARPNQIGQFREGGRTQPHRAPLAEPHLTGSGLGGQPEEIEPWGTGEKIRIEIPDGDAFKLDISSLKFPKYTVNGTEVEFNQVGFFQDQEWLLGNLPLLFLDLMINQVCPNKRVLERYDWLPCFAVAHEFSLLEGEIGLVLVEDERNQKGAALIKSLGGNMVAPIKFKPGGPFFIKDFEAGTLEQSCNSFKARFDTISDQYNAFKCKLEELLARPDLPQLINDVGDRRFLEKGLHESATPKININSLTFPKFVVNGTEVEFRHIITTDDVTLYINELPSFLIYLLSSAICPSKKMYQESMASLMNDKEFASESERAGLALIQNANGVKMPVLIKSFGENMVVPIKFKANEINGHWFTRDFEPGTLQEAYDSFEEIFNAYKRFGITDDLNVFLAKPNLSQLINDIADKYKLEDSQQELDGSQAELTLTPEDIVECEKYKKPIDQLISPTFNVGASQVKCDKVILFDKSVPILSLLYLLLRMEFEPNWSPAIKVALLTKEDFLSKPNQLGLTVVENYKDRSKTAMLILSWHDNSFVPIMFGVPEYVREDGSKYYYPDNNFKPSESKFAKKSVEDLFAKTNGGTFSLRPGVKLNEFLSDTNLAKLVIN